MLLSIVIPAYNIRDYIHRNIESFQKVDDKFKDKFELLVVNDGSKDDTVEVLEQLLREENRLNIRIISKENGGHGSAVNRGIDEAVGKYLKIIDGDDWINVRDFEEYIRRLEKTSVDMIVTDYSEQHVYKKFVKRISVVDKEDYYSSNTLSSIFPMHGLTYKTEIFKDNNIRLTEKIFYVDTQYTVFPLKFVKTWVYWNLDLYQYFLGRPNQSMAIENRLKHIEDHRIVTESILEFYKELNDGNLKKITYEFVLRLINARFIFSFLSKDRNKLLRETVSYIDKYGIDYKFQKNQRISYLLYINERLNRKLSFVVFPIANAKIKKLVEQGI